jgi:cytochrome P450
MTGILYYLLRSPEKRDELQREVRGAFTSTRDMDVTSLLKLPYLQAVLKEGMRIHPAVPQGLPRVSPGTMIEGIFVPQGVSVNRIWTLRIQP